MPEHFSRSTVEAKFWCSKCFKPTMHDVRAGRRGSCHECVRKLETQIEAQHAAKKPAPATQESLF